MFLELAFNRWTTTKNQDRKYYGRISISKLW